MIYFIGGAPRVGKSIVAKKIAEETSATFISTDDVCDKLAKTLSEEERKEKFPFPGFSGIASKNVLSPGECVRLQVVSSKSLEPELDKIVQDAISKNKSLVIEGVHLLPEHMRDLIDSHGSSKFQALIMESSNIDQIADGIEKNTSSDNWIRGSDPEVIRQVAEFVAAFSGYIEKEANKYDFSYFERTADFKGDMKHCMQDLLRGDR